MWWMFFQNLTQIFLLFFYFSNFGKSLQKKMLIWTMSLVINVFFASRHKPMGLLQQWSARLLKLPPQNYSKLPLEQFCWSYYYFFTPRHKLIPQHYILVYIFNTNIIALIFYHVFCTSYFCNFFRNGLI